VGSRDGYLYAINADGSLKWKYDTGGEIRRGASVLRDGSLLVGSMSTSTRDGSWWGKISKLSKDGVLVWSYDAGAEVTSKPLVQDVTIVFGTRATDDNPGKVVALKMDGVLKWSHNITAASHVNTDPVEGKNQHVFVGGSDGKVYAFQADGTLAWRYLSGKAVTSVTKCGDFLLFGSKNKFVYALDQSGRFLFKYGPVERAVDSQPSCEMDAAAPKNRGTVYFGSNDHSVYSIRFRTDRYEAWTLSDLQAYITEKGWAYTTANDKISYTSSTHTGSTHASTHDDAQGIRLNADHNRKTTKAELIRSIRIKEISTYSGRRAGKYPNAANPNTEYREAYNVGSTR